MSGEPKKEFRQSESEPKPEFLSKEKVTSETEEGEEEFHESKTEQLEEEPKAKGGGAAESVETEEFHEAESILSEENNEEDEFHEAEPIIEDDLVDEEFMKEEEASLGEEDFVARLEKAKIYKKEGNDQFGEMNYRDSILTYTKGLLICPLREKEFRSILYANRSAAKIKMGRNELAVDDCTKSLEYNPNYVRVLLRRAKLYEEMDKLDEALADFQKVYELDPSNKEAWSATQRLPPLVHERNEKLKTEMMGKLKDLGNIILKPFGLSTENFKLQQDPNSGGYSINFNK